MYNPNIKYQRSKIYTNSPHICPFCGNNIIVGTFKIKEKFHSFFIEAFVCEEHLNLKKIFSWQLALYYTFLIIDLYFLFSSRNLISIFTALIILSALVILGFAYFSIQGGKKKKIIANFIQLETFQEGFVISTKQNDWAEEFKRLNSCLELKKDIEDELRVLDAISMKNKKITNKIGYIAIITFILTMITLFSSFIFSQYAVMLILLLRILFIFFSLLLVLWGYIFGYLIVYKMPKRRSEIYFNFFK